jgi:AraC-like DNA-binding protein
MTGIIVMAGLAVVFYVLTLKEQGPAMGLDPSSAYDDYTLLSLSVFVYAIGLMGLRQPEVFDAHRFAARPPEAPLSVAVERPRYAKSGIDPETAKRHAGELLRVMESEKLYRTNDLTLLDLSVALNLSPHNLTEVINTQLGKNFYDFINAYRVEEVKRRLVDRAYDHLTLLGIGTDAGFNSKSSFNAVFRKHTGMTPSEYRRRGQAAGVGERPGDA